MQDDLTENLSTLIPARRDRRQIMRAAASFFGASAVSMGPQNSFEETRRGSRVWHRVVYVEDSLAAALASLSPDGGTVIVPPGYRETITSQIVLGSETQGIILQLMNNVVITFDIRDGHSSCFVVRDGSGIVGEQMGCKGPTRTGGCTINLAPTCNVQNVITTVEDPTGCVVLDNFQIDNVMNGTVANAFVNLVNLNDASITRNLKLSYFDCAGVKISATTGGVSTIGPLTLDTIFAGGNRENSVPLHISSDGDGSINGLVVNGGFWNDPGSGHGCIELHGVGAGGALRDVVFNGVYTQQHRGTTGVTGIKILNAHNITIQGAEFQVSDGTDGHTAISIAEDTPGGTSSIVVIASRISCAGGNLGLSNSINGDALLNATGSGNIPLYVYEGSASGLPHSRPWIGGPLCIGGVNIVPLGTTDPTAEPGVAAPQGSLGLRTNGGASTTLYVKTGSGDTVWTAK